MNKCNEIQMQYEANGQDCFNFAAKYGTSNVQIQAVLEFNELLDSVLLQKAVRLSIDAQPILGCLFIENNKKAYWERLEHIDEVAWYSFEKRENHEEAIKDFLKAPIGLDGGQQIEVKHIQGNEGSSIGIKVHHACSDVGGVKQYLLLLSEIYSKLCKNPEYKPDIETGRRDSKHYFDALGIDEPMQLFNPQQTGSQPTWAFPYQGLEFSQMHIGIIRFPSEFFKEIRAFAKEREVTINTMLLTAFYRSLFDMLTPNEGEEMEIYVTTDLRKVIPSDKKQDICNLSSMMAPRIARIEGESFEQTLKRVDEKIKALKSGDVGLESAVIMEALGRIEYTQCLQVLTGARQQTVDSKKSSPLLSNAGIIPILKFGESLATDAYIVTPSMFAPGFMLGASSYKDVLSLVVSYYEPSTRKEDVERLLHDIGEELEGIIN